MDLAMSGVSNGTWVHQWSRTAGAGSAGRSLTRAAGKVKLRNVLADKVIDLVGMRVDNGTQAQIWQDVFGENQLWRLDPVPERLLNKETPAPKPKEEPRRTTRTQTEKKTSGKAARRRVRTSKKSLPLRGSFFCGLQAAQNVVIIVKNRKAV